MSENTELTTKKPNTTDELDKLADRQMKLIEVPGTDQYKIQNTLEDGTIVETVPFPKGFMERLKMMPDDFSQVQTAIEEYNQEITSIRVYADSIESCIGYDSLIRVMGNYYRREVAYLRSKEGGELSPEEARAKVYRQKISDEDAKELMDKVLSISVDIIKFSDLLELNSYSPAAAENLWELIKREARAEFESGHRAAATFEPADYMTDAWNRASFLAVRESFCAEWQPRGGIELSMIDAAVEAWLLHQHWIKESVKRGTTRPRQESNQFGIWKLLNHDDNATQWENGYWDRPFVEEQEAIEHAAQMADRFQKMYFRALRALRDWRRYSPPVTINNPQQVNIAADGGQQVNYSGDQPGSVKRIND